MRSLNNHDKMGGGRGGPLGPGSSISSTSERLPGLASPLPGGIPLGAHGGPGDSGDEGDVVPPCGPIRIRNLEDLIRQLERHSARHTSPNGSEDIRSMSETEADRHYRLMEAAGGVPGLVPDSQSRFVDFSKKNSSRSYDPSKTRGWF